MGASPGEKRVVVGDEELHVADLVEHLPGVQQCLGRHARVKATFAADETFLHDRRRQATGGGAAGENLAGRARADDDHIEIRHCYGRQLAA
jgi:hypothetical protein